MCKDGLASNGTNIAGDRRIRINPRVLCPNWIMTAFQNSHSRRAQAIGMVAVGILGGFVVFQLIRSILKRKDYLMRKCFKRELETPFEMFT